MRRRRPRRAEGGGDAAAGAGREEPRRLALRYRAAAGFGLTALVLSGTLATIVYIVARADLVDQRESAANGQAYVNARLLRSRLQPLPEDVATVLAGLGVAGDGQALLRVDGRWYASSMDAGPDAVPAGLRDVVRSGAAGHQIVERDGLQLVVGVPIGAAEAEYYEVTPLDELDRTLDTLGSALVVGAGVASVAGGLVGALLTGAVLAPLRRVASVARRVVDGATDTRLAGDGDPDLVPLTSSFNEMLDDLNGRVVREARFASDVTHELRGPLTTLAAAVAVVNRRRDEVPPEVARALDALDGQVSSFNRLVLDLLEISRFDARAARLDARVVDVAELCGAVLEERDLHGVAVDVAGDVRAEVDALRFRQVVANLLENARHYAGGAVAVGVHGSDDGVRVTVDDAGPGVTAGERDVIFSRFARGAEGERAGAARGTGLGLALSAQHVRLHGGRIWVEDRPDGGARFVVELPREQP